MGLRSKLASLLGGNNPPLFQALEVEISSPCNLKCETCPNKEHRRPKTELPIETIQRIILELSKLGFQGSFSPHFYNEPLLDKRLSDILAFVRQHLPKVTINLFTNFTPMTVELYRRLLPLVDEFIVTSDQPEVQQAVAKITAGLTNEELTKLRTRSLKETGISNRAGAMDVGNTPQQRMTNCVFVNSMIIDAWGDVHLCCNDYFGKALFGNVKEQSLSDIWFSEEYVQARKLGAKGKHPLCTTCYWVEIGRASCRERV